MKKNSIIKTRNIAVIAIMSALGTILMYLEFPIPVMPGMIKFDFSELPALITSFAIGPFAGVVVCLLKNILHLLASQSAGVGELSNFLLGAFFSFTAGMIYKNHKTRKSALAGSVAGSTVMAVTSLIVNRFIIFPIYIKAMGMTDEIILSMYQEIMPGCNSLMKAILIFNVPFTFVKGIICSVITFMIYKKISPIIKGKKWQENKLLK